MNGCIAYIGPHTNVDDVRARRYGDLGAQQRIAAITAPAGTVGCGLVDDLATDTKRPGLGTSGSRSTEAGRLIGRRGGLRVPGIPARGTYQRFPSIGWMRTANAERVIAIPKRRDFSDCFMWALLARSLAPMREVRPSRASRGSPVWRAPVASFAADGRAMGPSYYGSCVTPYFGPGLARGCTGFRRRAIRGRRRGRPPATRGIRPRPRQRVFRTGTTPAMASSTSSTDVGLPTYRTMATSCSGREEPHRPREAVRGSGG